MKINLQSLTRFTFIGLVAFSTCLTSCKKEEGCTNPNATNYNPDAEEDDGTCVFDTSTGGGGGGGTTPTYIVPTTYTFTNVSYGGQTVRLLLVNDIAAKLAEAKTVQVTAAALNAIYENTPDLYTSISSGKKLSDKVVNQTVKDSIQAWFEQVERLSGPGATLIRTDGVDVAELIEKTLITSVFYFRAISDYANNIASKDNTTIVTGQGTAMEHTWDEAFGYFGAPRDFGSYTDSFTTTTSQKDSNGDSSFDPKSERAFQFAILAARRDLSVPAKDFTKVLFDAFLKGRAAITNKDYPKRDEAVTSIKLNWEKLLAAQSIHEINMFKAASFGTAEYSARWSKLKAYFDGIQFLSGNQLGATNVATIYSKIGSKPAETDATKLNDVLAIFKTTYGFTDAEIAAW